MPTQTVIIELTGEGKTDRGVPAQHSKSTPVRPDFGVVPVLLHKLCGTPNSMRIVPVSPPYLEKGNLQRKVRSAKLLAFQRQAHGAVFVVDTEGDSPKKVLKELMTGRNEKLREFPMAVGVAHPCIESWLLADADAIRSATNRDADIELPDQPESLPAPRKDRARNPKTELARLVGEGQRTPSRISTQIAQSIQELSRVEAACPQGFAPFAEEVRERILPLFEPPVDPA